MNRKRMMWIVANSLDCPLLRGYDAAFIELWSHTKEGEPRVWNINGEGTFYLSGGKFEPTPIGRLLMVVKSDVSSSRKKAIIELLGLAGKKILMIDTATNDKE